MKINMHEWKSMSVDERMELIRNHIKEKLGWWAK